MLQVKLFNYMYTDEMEKAVNRWLEEHKDVAVVEIKIMATSRTTYTCIIQYRV